MCLAGSCSVVTGKSVKQTYCSTDRFCLVYLEIKYVHLGIEDVIEGFLVILK
jgi:hypothetical protein